MLQTHYSSEIDFSNKALQDAEKALILQTLKETGGNKSEAARRLGITRKTLQNKFQKYELDQ